MGKNRTFARHEFSLVLIKLYIRGLAILHRFSVRSLASAAILFFRRMTIRLVRARKRNTLMNPRNSFLFWAFSTRDNTRIFNSFCVYRNFIESFYFGISAVEFWVLCFWVDFQSTVMCVCFFHQIFFWEWIKTFEFSSFRFACQFRIKQTFLCWHKKVTNRRKKTFIYHWKMRRTGYAIIFRNLRIIRKEKFVWRVLPLPEKKLFAKYRFHLQTIPMKWQNCTGALWSNMVRDLNGKREAFVWHGNWCVASFHALNQFCSQSN